MDEKLESIVEGEDSGPGLEGDPYPLRTVGIHRGERGYGVTVSGESPVIVQDVKDGGPAALAGVKKGDSIIKVNGNLVSQVNHKEVVEIIKSTQYVKLTLRSCPEGEVPNLTSPQDTSHRPLPPTPSSKSNERITAPLPVNTQLQNQMEMNKGKMLTMYLEKQRRVRDNIIVELQRGPSKVLQRNLEKELDSINRQIAKIQEELKNMKDIEAQLHSHPRSSPRSPPLSRPSFSHPHSQPSHHQTHVRSASEIPPPLPARSRSLVSQISAPNISGSFASLPCAPPLPPRPPHLERVGEGGLAQSLENIHKVQSLSHSASSVSEPGSRPPSHYRAKSSPDPLGLHSSPGPCRLSGSDSVSDLSQTGSNTNRSKVSSVYNEDMVQGEPPGTPPPPYGYLPADEADENYSVIMDDCDGGGEFAPSAPPLPSLPGPPLPSRPSLPGLPPKPGSHHASPFASQVTSPTSPDGQVTPTSMAGLLPTQPILSMEDEEFSDPEPLEDHGPFQSLNKLWNHNAYHSVFMNYVISNCDSSSLFFYVITHLYKEGVGKEMKRWAYEITSCFLLPGAPLRLSNVEESVLHEIDETLHNELDKEEILRKVFWKARQRCREDLNEQLADFRNKRSAGLGSIFGPRDHVLEESIHNKAKELQIVEHLLVPCLESVSEDLKNATDQMLVTASSLATILLKYYGVRSQQAHVLIDRCPLFVSKERPLRSKIFRGNKKQVYREHQFIQHTYYSVTYCNHCGLIIWGIAPQGYQCANCEMNIHKSCAKQVEEVCIGQLHKKDRSRDIRFSSILGKIMPDDKDNRRKVSQVNATQIEKARKGFEEDNSEFPGHISETDSLTGTVESRSWNSSRARNRDKGGSGVGGPAWGSGKEQRRSDPGTVSNHHANSTSVVPTANANSHAASSTTSSSTGLEVANNGSENLDEYGSPDSSSTNVCSTDSAPLAALNKHNLPKKKSSTSINRSESCKEKQHARKRPRESRKHSDPNIPTSKSGDVDAESGLISGNSGSSSNSSLSPSQESPSTSLEHVSRADVPLPAPVLENDSDIEAELDLPNWQKLVSHDQIKRLKPKERKRQDTINELFHTERTHVRVLKVLKHLFHLPMLEAGILSKEQSEMLFPNIDQILEIHTTFNQAMKKRREEEPLVIRVGDLLVNMFDGEQGEHFQQQAAEFIRMQGIALENLKQKQKRDQRLSAFLQEQENNPACRRLQLKDMLPAGFQRLSKYPLLIESLLAYTDSNKQSEEYEQISRALERSKEILAYVNAAVQEAENNQKLSEIQRRLDQSSLAKNKHGHSDELRGNLDLTKHKLIYEGPLTWRIAKGQKNIDLHVLLLDEFIVLLQKADDKYILKNHSINKSLGKDDNKLTHSPIIKYGPSMLFRAVATDRCAFFIVTTQSGGAHIYELVTISANERKVWFRHIQEAQEAYGARDGRNRRSQPPTPLPDPDDHPGSSGDALRDVDDDVDGGETADGTNDISGDTKAQSGSGKATEPAVKPEEPLGSTSTASQPPASSETLANKTAEADGASSGSSGPGGPSPSAGRSPASGRRLQEVQIIQIVEGPTLIQPSEVKVSQGVVLSAEPVLTPIEHLRRKDLKIRQALEEKQHIIADILNIPHEHFENVADMAGEPAVGNKEPRELVLAAMYQAKCLQETLNEALNIRESDIVAARANNDSANKLSSLPLYQAPMTKLMAISTSLSQQLSSLLNLVSERDDERDRMRKELVASRERLHLLHMRQNSLTNQTSTPTQHSDITTSTSTTAATPPTATSPHTSRPSSFVSVASSVPDHSDSLDHHDTDEEGRVDAPKVNSTHLEEGEDSKEGSVAETFEDAVSGSEPADTAAGEGEHSSGSRECLGDGAAVRGPEGITESSTT
ncbi:rho guanine nucleotide exchange factor 11-like [Penaeus chinensis]|uniref:rho guanine nucleotide exchange factor 11-like n=1 Tax=Penaeus chinensis TaxID=139456 RepID=UPI001FB6E237|nr:rho guanine nucleotide exchange factor 11-like [Penaeus chinensis]